MIFLDPIQMLENSQLIGLKFKVFHVIGLNRDAYNLEVARLQTNSNYTVKHQAVLFSTYRGNDIKMFENKDQWYPWQKEIYQKVFDEKGAFTQAHPRKIISIVDKKGNSGKSSFFKWWFYTHPNSIGRIGYGSASQLRSSIVNIGQKPLYVIDLARTKSKDDRQEDLLSVLEDAKSGLVSNAMYGSGKTLIMEPPHIIVSSNYVLNYNLLSEDRWEVYEITSSNRLKALDRKKVSVATSKNSKKYSRV